MDLAGFDLWEVGVDRQTTLWLRGGFPRSFLAEDEEASTAWREDFIRTFLERDIPQLGIIIPAETLRRCWTMLAYYHGQIWNAVQLVRSLGTSENTARRYLDALTPIGISSNKYQDFRLNTICSLILVNKPLYIVEKQPISESPEIPMIPRQKFEKILGDRKIADFIREQALRLTCTAMDLWPFAADMGYEGEPFIWGEDDRRHLMARLDALFFHLYSLDRNDADYILA